MSERLFPMQDGPPIPWGLAVAVYGNLYEPFFEQRVADLARRGGGGWTEVAYLWKEAERRGKSAHKERCREAIAALVGDKGGNQV